MVYGDIDSFAVDLAAQANKFQPAVGLKALPLIPNLRLGLNIAACDGLPLVVIIDQESRTSQGRRLSLTASRIKWENLFSNLVSLSQTDSLYGQAHYVLLKDTKEIENLKDYRSDNFVYVLKPDSFGVTGRVVASFLDKESLSSVALGAAFDAARIPRKTLDDSRQHVRQGRRKGIAWESQEPRADGSARSTPPGERPHLQDQE